MKKGKKLLALLMVAMLAVSAASCSSNETTSSSESSGTDSSAAASTDGEEKLDVTLSYMASQDWVQDAEMELGEKFAEETGIKIDYQIVPSDQYNNLLMTRLNTGECTDMFGSQSGTQFVKIVYIFVGYHPFFLGNIDGNSPYIVNDFSQLREIDCYKILHIQGEILIDGFNRKLWAAVCISMIDLCLSIAIYRDISITGDRGQLDFSMLPVNRKDHQRIGTPHIIIVP